MVSLSSGERVRRSMTSTETPSRRQRVGGLQRLVQHQAVADKGQVVARALDVRLADWDEEVALGHLALDRPVQLLVFQEQHRVGAAQGGAEQARGVVGRARRDDVQARHVAEKGLDRLGMIQRAADAAPVRRPNHHRHAELPVRAVAHLGRFVDDLVERRVDEVGELDLADRPDAVERHADADADDGQLGQRAVDDPARAELGEEALGCAEDAAAGAYVLARNDNGRVAAHFRGHRLAQRFDVALNRHGAGLRRPGA